MTTDMNKCHIASSGNVITAKGRASYAQYLVESQERKNEDTGKVSHVYTSNLVFPPDTDLSVLKNAMGKIALGKTDGDKKRAKTFVDKRFLDPNNLPGGGKPMGDDFEGWTLMRSTSSYKPKFAYPNGKPVPDEELSKELYSGRWVRITVNPYWSSNKKNPGVFIGLVNVQLLDHDENLGVAIPDAEDEFGAVEGIESGDSAGSDNDGEDLDDMFG